MEVFMVGGFPGEIRCRWPMIDGSGLGPGESDADGSLSRDLLQSATLRNNVLIVCPPQTSPADRARCTLILGFISLPEFIDVYGRRVAELIDLRAQVDQQRLALRRTNDRLQNCLRGTNGTGLGLVTALDWAGSGDGLGRRWVRVAPRFFCVAGVALGDICLHFVWRGTNGTGLGLVTALFGARSVWRRASFAWQVWHLATSAFVLCGRRGTWQHLPSLCVASVALTALGWFW
eukprot:s3477_g2.t1